MFHILAFFSNLGAVASFTDLQALLDNVFGQRNGHYLYGSDLSLFAGTVLCSSSDLTRIQVVTPSLRSVGRPMLRPWNQDTSTPNDPNLSLMLQRSPLLRGQEEITVQAITGAAVDVYALLWVITGLQPIPPVGNIITLQARSTQAAATQTWTELLDVNPGEGWYETLPKGRYAVVGSECISATGVAHRWIFDNQIFRPGALSSGAIGERTHEVFYDGRLGTWGTFVSQVPPRIEVLCNAADAPHDIFLQVVRIGD